MPRPAEPNDGGEDALKPMSATGLAGERLRLVTCSFTQWAADASDTVPVRISRGYPRFWRGPALEYVEQLAPTRAMLAAPDATLAAAGGFAAVYVERLDVHADEIAAALAEIQARHPGETLCLLCYERVSDGAECHRRMFADWWQAKTGLDVVELGRSAAATTRRPA